MGLKDTLKRIFQKDERFKEMEREVKLQKMIEDRQKSSNEREVEKFMKQRREEELKKQVNQIHEMEKQKFWKNDFGVSKNIFKGHKSIMENELNMLGRGNLL